MRLTARVPATSANLGPGFDCFGLALDLCNEVTIETDAEPGVSWEGEGADELPVDGTDLVSRAIAAAVQRQRTFHPDAAAPAFALHGVNRIPLECGLGSSSAAAVAGTALASAMLGPAGWERDRYTTFAYAAELEGHPDNAAPATYGGFTVVLSDGYVHRFDVSEAIRPILLIPNSVRLATHAAREALSDHVRRGDAVFNIGHGALLVHALIAGDLDLLRVALHDRIHQGHRLALVPEVRDVFDELNRTRAVCVSGSGPTLLVFERERDPTPDPGEAWRVLRIPVRSAGVEVVEG